MKHFGLMLLLLFGSFSSHLQSSTRENEYVSAVTKDSQARLQLTTSIVNRLSCSPELFALSMRFTFKNTGSERVMVDKRSFHVRAMVSSSAHAASARKYIIESRGDMWGMFPFQPKDLSNFAILEPGEVYELNDERQSFFVSDESPGTRSYLRSGNYFLQVEVVTWPYLNKPGPFRKMWKDKGYLWFEGITSQPMPFTIEKNRSKCR
jgi:hypothetical protein